MMGNEYIILPELSIRKMKILQMNFPFKQCVYTNQSKDNVLEKLTWALKDTSVYEPLEMKKYIKATNHQNFQKILCHNKDKGLPMLLTNLSL